MSVTCSYGDIVAVRLDSIAADSSATVVRHAVVVSADSINENLPTVIVCPLIDAEDFRESRLGATFIPRTESGLELDSLVLSLQIKTILKDQILRRIGILPVAFQLQLKESLQAVLELEN